jgi:hypothetical protein
MERTGRTLDEVLDFGRAHGHLCGVELDPAHPDADSAHGVVASHGGWIVGYDGSMGVWTAR